MQVIERVSEVLNYAWLFRMVWLAGRFGGGKTSLAISICQWLCGRSYARYIASNIDLAIGTEVRSGVSAAELTRVDCNGPVYKNTVILMDEGWQDLGKGTSRRQINQWLGFMRKGNNFLVIPSALPLVSDVAALKVERVFNGLTVGLPIWFYRWELGDYRKGGDHGFHLFRNPTSVFGLYDTTAIPREDYKIYEIWQDAEAEGD